MFWLYAESALLMLIVSVVVWLTGRARLVRASALSCSFAVPDGRVDAIKGALIFVQAKMFKIIRPASNCFEVHFVHGGQMVKALQQH